MKEKDLLVFFGGVMMEISKWKDDRSMETAANMRQVPLSEFLSKGVRLDRFL